MDLTSTQHEEEEVISLNSLDRSHKLQHDNNIKSKEVLVYCQNFNRMKSAVKVNEIYKQVAACSFPVILGTETSWDASVTNEEVVFRDGRRMK